MESTTVRKDTTVKVFREDAHRWRVVYQDAHLDPDFAPRPARQGRPEPRESVRRDASTSTVEPGKCLTPLHVDRKAALPGEGGGGNTTSHADHPGAGTQAFQLERKGRNKLR